MRGKLFVISGPSGSGKTTLLARVLSSVGNLRFSVSYTTRPMRGGEVGGKHYVFVSREEFEDMIGRDFFAEWAEVHGNFYGTPRGDIEKWTRGGVDVVLDIDVRGAARLRGAFPDAVFVFVVPPSIGILEKRLRDRKSDADGDISLRLEAAREEVERARDYDYIVINDDMAAAAAKIEAVVLCEREDRPGASCDSFAGTLAVSRSARRENVYGPSFLRGFGIG